MSALQFLEAIKACPADKLDIEMIQFIYDRLFTAAPAPKTTKKSKKTTDDKKDDADKPKTKRTLNDTLAAKNAFWASKKAEGMKYKDCLEIWKSMTAEEKAEWKIKKTEPENVDQPEKVDDEVSVDDLADVIDAEIKNL
jgi:hypothetical protein